MKNANDVVVSLLLFSLGCVLLASYLRSLARDAGARWARTSGGEGIRDARGTARAMVGDPSVVPADLVPAGAWARWRRAAAVSGSGNHATALRGVRMDEPWLVVRARVEGADAAVIAVRRDPSLFIDWAAAERRARIVAAQIPNRIE